MLQPSFRHEVLMEEEEEVLEVDEILTLMTRQLMFLSSESLKSNHEVLHVAHDQVRDDDEMEEDHDMVQVHAQVKDEKHKRHDVLRKRH